MSTNEKVEEAELVEKSVAEEESKVGSEDSFEYRARSKKLTSWIIFGSIFCVILVIISIFFFENLYQGIYDYYYPYLKVKKFNPEDCVFKEFNIASATIDFNYTAKFVNNAVYDVFITKVDIDIIREEKVVSTIKGDWAKDPLLCPKDRTTLIPLIIQVDTTEFIMDGTMAIMLAEYAEDEKVRFDFDGYFRAYADGLEWIVVNVPCKGSSKTKIEV